MKLEDFKRMTLEDRLDYLFTHSVKDSEQRFNDEKGKWVQKECAHKMRPIGNGIYQCVECQMITD